MTQHATAMDNMYRYQRHVYDLTRAYYLLGRDRMIAALQVPSGGSVLEIGCGTGRNLLAVARRYPDCHLHGIDISDEMLKTARARIARTAQAGAITLAQGDALTFDPQGLFGRAHFDRIYFSYTLSMIPAWQEAVRHATRLLAPDGQLFIVDFGPCEGLPGWFGRGLRSWLSRFDVTPRPELAAACPPLPLRMGQSWVSQPVFGGYAVIASVAPRRSRMAIPSRGDMPFGDTDGLHEAMPMLGVF